MPVIKARRSIARKAENLHSNVITQTWSYQKERDEKISGLRVIHAAPDFILNLKLGRESPLRPASPRRCDELVLIIKVGFKKP